MNYVSQNIKFLRKKLGFTQPQFANELGVSRNNVDSYERGGIPKPDILAQIAELFSIDLRKFLAEEMNSFSYDTFIIKNNGIVSDNTTEQIDTTDNPSLKAVNLINKLKSNFLSETERVEIGDELIKQFVTLMDKKSVVDNELLEAYKTMKELYSKI